MVYHKQEYLINRNNGLSRGRANKNTGIEKAHTFNIDKSFIKLILTAKALFPNLGDPKLNGLDWIYSIIGFTDTPLLDFNNFCLSNHLNCIFFSRYNIILFKKTKTGTIISHNNGSSQKFNNNIDSS